MPNSAIAQLISQHIPAGLPHPGNPETGQPPITIPLPAFRTAGMPAEMAERINNTTGLIGEAIVNLIETKGESEIVPRAELDKLRVAELPIGHMTPILCRVCRKPILHIATTDGPAFLDPSVIAGANADCPHAVMT